MLLTLVGFRRSKGEYEGINYDNVICYCESDVVVKDLQGISTEVVKVPYTLFKEYGLALNSQFDVGYNKFGKVSHIFM